MLYNQGSDLTILKIRIYDMDVRLYWVQVPGPPITHFFNHYTSNLIFITDIILVDLLGFNSSDTQK